MDVANAIFGTCNLQHLGMGGNDDMNLYADWLAASKGFLRSLVNNSKQEDTEKSFNDPDSFLWFCQQETFDKEIQTN